MHKSKIIIVLFFSIVINQSLTHAQILDIPDKYFLQNLINDGYDKNLNGSIEINEALLINKIYINDSLIKSLKGIEEFKNLKVFIEYIGFYSGSNAICYCTKTIINSIDFSNNLFLEYVDFADAGYVEFVNLEKNSKLKHVSLRRVKNSIFDFSNQPHLKYLHLDDGILVSLNLTNNSELDSLYVTDYNLSCLDIRKNVKLTSLYLSYPATFLDLCKNVNLRRLYLAIDVKVIDLSKCTLLNEVYFRRARQFYVVKQINLSTLSNLQKLTIDGGFDSLRVCLGNQPTINNDSKVTFTNNCQVSCIQAPSFEILPSNRICYDDTLTFKINPYYLNSIYQWKIGGKTTVGDTGNNKFVSDNQGDYSVTLLSFSDCYKDSIVKNFKIDSLPLKPNLGDSILCFSSPQTLNAGNTYTNYLWNTGSTNSNIFINKSGIYYVKVSNTCGYISDTISVKVKEKLLQLNASRVCKTDTTYFIYSSTETIYNYHWAYGNNATSNTNQTKYKYPQAGTYNANLIVDYKCFSDTASTEVIVDDTPILNLGDSILICNDTPIELNAGDGFVSYLWQDGATQQLYTATNSGTYSVSVSNTCGTQKDSIIVKKVQLSIPNIITPNGDGLNEALDIASPMQSPIHLSIINRWGAEVFESSDYQNNWNAHDLSDGIYYYTTHYEGCPTVKGWVQVAR